MSPEPLIEFRDVTKRFGSRTILSGVNLKIHEGEVTTIIGLSGTGKSVTLKHIIGLLKPDSGRILYRGKPIDRMSRKEWNEYIGRISYMFQNNALFDSMTIFDNLALPLRQTTHLSKEEIVKKVMGRIEQTELTEVVHKYPSELSGGMQKRAALARALVTDPQIVLFDEPTTGQDPIRKNAILGMVAHNQKRFGFTAVLISHEIPDVFYISNCILVLYKKKIIFEGTPEAFQSFEHPFMDEVLASLEGLEENLTGLYSRRHFKVRYQVALSKRRQADTYVVAVFKLDDLGNVENAFGHDKTQGILRAMGAYINKHAESVGGFSTRQTIDEFTTVLPFSNMEEAERIMGDFVNDFKNVGIRSITSVIDGQGPSNSCVLVRILGGLAKGNPHVEMESIVEFARFNLKPIAQISCERGGVPQ